MVNFIKNYLWAFLWSLFILFVCLIPSSELPKINFFSEYHVDKFIHFFLYFIQSALFLLLGSYKTNTNYFRRKHTIFVLFYGLLLGIIIEFTQQHYIVGRAGNLYDFIADSLGILLGLSFFARKKSTLIEPI